MTSPLLLTMRGLVALGILAVGPTLCWDLLLRQGWIGNATPQQHLEGSMLAFLLACAGVGVFAVWQPPGPPWRPVRAAGVVARYVPFLLVWVGILVAYLALARWLGSPVPAQRELAYVAGADFARPGFWLVVAGCCLGAPLAEEIVFRGYLQGALGGAVRPTTAIALTALVFGCAHTLAYALPVACLGAFFGWLVYRFGSLWPAVLGHALHNGTTVLVTVLWPESFTMLYTR